MKILIPLIALLSFTLFSSVTNAKPVEGKDVSLVCKWTLYSNQVETFVIKSGNKEVYWVNQNKRLPVMKINEGILEFEGMYDRLQMSGGTWKQNVPIGFRINRVNGDLYIRKVKTPAGYNNKCSAVDKLF